MGKVQTIPRNGLVGEWILDGNALDTSGNGKNGTATNVTYASTDRGYQSQTGVFNGSSSKIDTTLTGLTNNFSVSIWASRGDADSRIFSCYNSGIVFTSSGNPTAVYYDGGADRPCSSGMAIADNNLYHIVWTKSSTEGQKIYVDGVLKGTEASTSNLSLGYDSSVGIGYFRAFNGDYHSGKIQSVRYYNRILSTQEINSLYMEGLRKLGGAGLAPLTDGLVAYYDFNGDAQDIIGGNTGTVTGATLTTDRFGNSNRAYSLNGSSNYILQTSPTIYGDLTWSIYVKFSVLQGELIGAFNTANPATRLYYTAGKIGGEFWISTGNGRNWTIDTFSPTTGVWYNIIITRTSSTGLVTAMINGIVYSITYTSVGGTPTGSITTSTPLGFGVLNYSNGSKANYVNGLIGEIFIFNRALTSSEALALYQLSSQRYLTPLLH